MLSSNDMTIPKGTLINVATVTVGSLVGLTLKHLFSPEMESIVFQGLGLGTILIGVKLALRCPEGYMLHVIFSLILGGILGQWIALDSLIQDFSAFLKSMISNEDTGFSEGLVTAFLLFCIGSMTVIGSIEEGLTGNRELLMVKSTLDGFSAIFLTSTFGIGVLFSTIPLLIFQGGLTLGAKKISNFLDNDMLDGLTSVGGVLILGISINILKLGHIPLENLLPGLIIILLGIKLFPRKNNIKAVPKAL